MPAGKHSGGETQRSSHNAEKNVARHKHYQDTFGRDSESSQDSNLIAASPDISEPEHSDPDGTGRDHDRYQYRRETFACLSQFRPSGFFFFNCQLGPLGDLRPGLGPGNGAGASLDDLRIP